MSEITKGLREGIVEYPKRWSGDTHFDKGGPVDYEATATLMSKAADTIDDLLEALREAREALVLLLQYEPVREDFQRAPKGDRQFATAVSDFKNAGERLARIDAVLKKAGVP